MAEMNHATQTSILSGVLQKLLSGVPPINYALKGNCMRCIVDASLKNNPIIAQLQTKPGSSKSVIVQGEVNPGQAYETPVAVLTIKSIALAPCELPESLTASDIFAGQLQWEGVETPASDPYRYFLTAYDVLLDTSDVDPAEYVAQSKNVSGFFEAIQVNLSTIFRFKVEAIEPPYQH